MHLPPSVKKKKAKKKPAQSGSPSSAASGAGSAGARRPVLSDALKARLSAIVRAPSPSSVDFRVGTHTVRSGIRTDGLGSADLSTLAEHQREAQPDVSAVLDRDADRARYEERERTTRELREQLRKLREVRRTRSEPRDVPAASNADFLQTLRTPRPARPTMTTIDTEHRPRETHGFVLPEAATAGRPVITASGAYLPEYDRSSTGQAIPTKGMNVLAAPTRERAHGSHSHQRGASGPPDPSNMVPLSGSLNVDSIGGFEKTINPLAATAMSASGGVSRTAISARAAASSHLRVSTTYDPDRWRPAIIAPSGLADLRTSAAGRSAPSALAVRTVEQLARSNPASQTRRFESPAGSSSHSLGLGQLQSDRFASAAKPRTSKSAMLAPRAQSAIRSLHLADNPRTAFKPVRSSGQQMQDAMFRQAVSHAAPPAARPAAPSTSSGTPGSPVQFNFEGTAELEGRALPDFPHISTGMSSEAAASRLSAEAADFAAREDRRQKRKRGEASDSGDERDAPKARAASSAAPPPGTAPSRRPRRVTFAKGPATVVREDD